MSKSARLSGILLAAATSLLGATALAAPREYPVFQTDHPPVIDGDLRDDLWRAVPWSADFTGPHGAKADVQTQFAMAWDEKFLYVAVRCKEPNPETIHAGIVGQDPRIVNDDHIEIILARSDNPDAFFQIFLNAGRGRLDQWIEKGHLASGPVQELAGLDSAARVQAGEWAVEAAIPLSGIGWPFKEGAMLTGNVCRVRPAGVIKRMAWSPVEKVFLDPAEFGVFKLSGPAPKANRVQGGDTILLRNGDFLNGSLVGFADGKIQFSAPTLAEDVSFSAAEAQRLDLAWTEADAAPTRFILNDGAEIGGKIVSLSAETVGVESPSLGRISIPRGALSSISFSGFSIESHFETGVLKPWEAVLGTCSFSDGVLHLSGPARGGQYQEILSLPLHQDKAVTFIADYDSSPALAPVAIELFADRGRPQMQIQNGIMLYLLKSPMFVVHKGGQSAIQPGASESVPLAAGPTQIKVTYDPADGSARAWYNGKPAADMTSPDGPKEGEYVVFGATRPLAIRRLAVYCGLPAPDEPPTGPKPGEVLADLSNGDAVRASQVEFADGGFVFTTEFGRMKVGLDRVTSLAFPAKAEKPPAGEGAAWVETSGSRFALEVLAITGESVIGRSPEFGEVKLQRRMVKSITFPTP